MRNKTKASQPIASCFARAGHTTRRKTRTPQRRKPRTDDATHELEVRQVRWVDVGQWVRLERRRVNRRREQRVVGLEHLPREHAASRITHVHSLSFDMGDKTSPDSTHNAPATTEVAPTYLYHSRVTPPASTPSSPAKEMDNRPRIFSGVMNCSAWKESSNSRERRTCMGSDWRRYSGISRSSCDRKNGRLLLKFSTTAHCGTRTMADRWDWQHNETADTTTASDMTTGQPWPTVPRNSSATHKPHTRQPKVRDSNNSQ